MKTLIFGGNSSVGKSLAEILPEKLSSSDIIFYFNSNDCNLMYREDIHSILHCYKPDNVVMLAATVGGIFDNVNRPYDYLMQNAIINSNIIDECKENNVQRLLCLSSTCAYPDILDDSQYPLSENRVHEGPPTISNFGYGYAKRLMQVQLENCNKQYNTKYSYFIPCNLYGPHSHYDAGSHFLGKLIRKIWEYKQGIINKIEMAGGSSAYRQYLYTPDLAQCIKTWIFDNDHTPIMANIAPETNLSIREITDIALNICDCDAKVRFLNENMSGQQRKDVSSKLLLSRYNNFSFTPLEVGVRETYSKVCELWK